MNHTPEDIPEIRAVVEILIAKGLNKDEVEALIIPFCTVEYRTGYRECAQRIVEFLTSEKINQQTINIIKFQCGLKG